MTTVRRVACEAVPDPASASWPNAPVEVGALVFPELRVEIDAIARLDVDLRQAA